jgi:hypothetical protein
MDKNRRKELQEEYKEMKTYMGVIKITNNANGKIFVSAFPNLKNKWLTLRAQLDMGRHPNSHLQRDWKEYGSDYFTYEILEEKATNDVNDVRWEVKQIEKIWLEELQPYGDRGYNKLK